MASMNVSMIRDYVNQKYPGLPTDDQSLQRLMDNSRGGDPGYIDQAILSSPSYQQQQTTNAQNAYKAQTDAAVGGLTQGKTDLAGQYADLLKTVKGQYDPLINSTTATAGAALSKRGLTPDSQLFQQETQGALAPIYGAEAGNAQTIGAGSITDTNTYNQAIAAAKMGAAGTASQLPLQYGNLQLAQSALPSQIAANQAQANQANANAKASSFLPVSPGVSFFNTGNNSAVNMAQLLAKSMGFNLTP